MPYKYLTETGVIVADTSTLKTEVQAEYVGAFGPSLLLADDTPQGRAIDVEVTARDGVVRLAAELANQINPNINSGIYLEGVCALHNVIPTVQSFTLVPGVLLTGAPSTVIPADSRVTDPSGNFFKSLTQLTIGVGGTVTGDFQAMEAGPIDPAPGSITQIIDGVFGWYTVTNPNAATPGAVTEEDDALRLARNDKLSLLSKGPVEAISSNVLNVPNVRSVSIRENDDSAPATIDGVLMTASSTWICVQGGADNDIALALLRSKQTGSPFTIGLNNGTPVAVSLTDPISGQAYPIRFTRTVYVPVAIRVTVAPGTSLDPATAIPDAVLRYANGQLPGERGFINGAAVSPFETASAINQRVPEFFIRKVEVGTIASGPVFSTNEVPIALWEAAEILSGNIIVVVA